MESSFCCYRLPAAASRCPAPQFLPGLSVELSSMNLSNLFLHVFICVTSITSQGNEFCSMVMCSMELYPGLFLISHLINFWAVHFFLYFWKRTQLFPLHFLLLIPVSIKLSHVFFKLRNYLYPYIVWKLF